MDSSILKVALVGYGYWGPNLLRNLLNNARVDVRWVCDLDETNRQRVQRDAPQVAVTHSFTRVLHDDSVQAIVFAVPTPFHAALAARALRAKKHVFVEKPMTATSLQARKLVALAKQQQRVLMVDHPFLFSAPIQKLSQLIEEDVLGKLYYFQSSRLNLGRLQKDSDVISDLAPHDFSILDFLTHGQRPTKVRAAGMPFVGKKYAEYAQIQLWYPKNFFASVELSWLSPVKVRSITAVGAKAMVTIDDTEPSEKLRIYDKRVELGVDAATPFRPVYRSGDVVIPQLSTQETLAHVVETFVAAVLDNGSTPSDGEAGQRVVELLERAQKALRTGRTL